MNSLTSNQKAIKNKKALESKTPGLFKYLRCRRYYFFFATFLVAFFATFLVAFLATFLVAFFATFFAAFFATFFAMCPPYGCGWLIAVTLVLIS